MLYTQEVGLTGVVIIAVAVGMTLPILSRARQLSKAVITCKNHPPPDRLIGLNTGLSNLGPSRSGLSVLGLLLCDILCSRWNSAHNFSILHPL